MLRRNLSRYDDSIFQHRSVEEFTSSDVQGGIHSIDYHGGPLDVWIRPYSRATTTVVTFHGAVSSAPNVTTPVFTGRRVTRHIPAHTIFIADPSLEKHSTLRLGWHAGNATQPLQVELPHILEHIFRSLGSLNNVFYGGSGGGFASLYYSAQFPGSLALAANPQTRITRYNPSAVSTYMRECWNLDDPARLGDYICEDLTELYASDTGNTVGYLQNAVDRHVTHHMNPFFERVCETTQAYKLIETWGPKHTPPPKDLVEHILASAVKLDGDWATALEGTLFDRYHR